MPTRPWWADTPKPKMADSPEWQKQATHMSENKIDIGKSLISRDYYHWGYTPGQKIYYIDQHLARLNIEYYAEHEPKKHKFSIFVDKTFQQPLEGIIDELTPKYNYPLPNLKGGKVYCSCRKFVPKELERNKKKDEWLFALYGESQIFRDDGLEYTAIIFRNKERTIFGIKEWLGGEQIRWNAKEKMAAKIAMDPNFRETLISDDPDIPKMWRDADKRG